MNTLSMPFVHPLLKSPILIGLALVGLCEPYNGAPSHSGHINSEVRQKYAYRSQ